MKRLITVIMLAGALAFMSCDEAVNEEKNKCIDKLDENLNLIIVLCANPDYWSSRGYTDSADCRNFEGGIALIQYYECKTEDALD